MSNKRSSNVLDLTKEESTEEPQEQVTRVLDLTVEPPNVLDLTEEEEELAPPAKRTEPIVPIVDLTGDDNIPIDYGEETLAELPGPKYTSSDFHGTPGKSREYAIAVDEEESLQPMQLFPPSPARTAPDVMEEEDATSSSTLPLSVTFPAQTALKFVSDSVLGSRIDRDFHEAEGYYDIGYESMFFRQDIIDEFLRNVLLESPLPAFVYNRDDILGTLCFDANNLGNHYAEIQSDNYSARTTANIRLLHRYINKNICSNIKFSYLTNSLTNALNPEGAPSETFDMIVCATPDFVNVSLPLEERFKSLKGMLIVERGECTKKPNAYSLNLVCASSGTKGIGGILMACYLYTLLSHPPMSTGSTTLPSGDGRLYLSEDAENNRITTAFATDDPLLPVEQYALLELALGYTNLVGLCLYEKFGFRFSPDLFGDDCFNDRRNLPMAIDFENDPNYAFLSQQERKEKVLSILVTRNGDKGFAKDTICSVEQTIRANHANSVFQKKKLWLVLGILKTMLLSVDHQSDFTPEDFSPDRVATDDGFDYIKGMKQIYALLYPRPSVSSVRSRQQTASPTFVAPTLAELSLRLHDLVDYIESPQVYDFLQKLRSKQPLEDVERDLKLILDQVRPNTAIAYGGAKRKTKRRQLCRRNKTWCKKQKGKKKTLRAGRRRTRKTKR